MKVEEGNNTTGIAHNIGQKALWDDFKKEHFVKLLLAHNKVCLHNQGRKRWRQDTWVRIAEQMNTKFPGSNMSLVQIKQLERGLKKLYKSLQKILMEPGFEWDYGNNTIVASDNHWRMLLQRDQKAKKWHRKILPYYAELDALYGTQGGENEKHGSNDPLCLSSRANSTCVSSDGNEEAEHSSCSTLSPPRNQDERLYFPKRPDLFFEPTANSSLKRSADSRLTELRRDRKENLLCQEEAEPMIKKVANNTDYIFSIAKCMKAYHELSAFESSDLLHVGEIFKDEQNREIFLAFRKDVRAHWLSAMITTRKQALSRPSSKE